MEKEILYTIDPEYFDIEASDEVVSIEDEQKHDGIYGLIVDAIQAKGESINTYKSYIATLNQDELKDKKIIDIFNQILEKELEEVAILQNCLVDFDSQTEDVFEDQTASI